LGATRLRRGVGLTGDSVAPELALIAALSEGGMYFPVVRAGVVSDLLSSTGGGAATTQQEFFTTYKKLKNQQFILFNNIYFMNA
jgi:hypothetical protein